MPHHTPAYDTTPMHATITFYNRDADGEDNILTSSDATGITMQTAKRRAATLAKGYGLTPSTRQWIHKGKEHARRYYTDKKGNRVKIEIRRS